MEYSECLPTLLKPLAERTCFSQAHAPCPARLERVSGHGEIHRISEVLAGQHAADAAPNGGRLRPPIDLALQVSTIVARVSPWPHVGPESPRPPMAGP